jgi:hypothetical protein
MKMEVEVSGLRWRNLGISVPGMERREEKALVMLTRAMIPLSKF